MEQRKVVLITGGAMGQGRAHALKYAENGFDVVLGDMLDPTDERFQETVKEVEQRGGKASGLYGTPQLATYCMSKWGILGLTKTLAKEVGSKGIIVNALCPTKVKTPMCETESYVKFINDLTGKNFANWQEMYEGVPFLEVDDIADMVYWLGTSRAAGKFNGREVALDLGTLQ